MRAIQSLLSLNRGVVSRLGLARMDVKRLAMAAEVQTNWMPRVLGSMMLRPGMKHIGSTAANAPARLLKFIFSTTDTALLELTNAAMRVWINDAPLTRPAVTTTIVNGEFTTNLASWTSHDEAGAISAWSAANSMALLGTGTGMAIREQSVAVANVGTEHGVRIVISTGPVVVRIGTTSGADDLIGETTLGTGTHSLSVAPTGANMFIRFQSVLARTVYVYSCEIEAAGAVSLPTPWTTASLNNVRIDQSGDVVYVACSGFQQRMIQRRGTRPNARSWSVVLYEPEDGPFKVLNTTPTTLTPAATSGDILVTSSRPIFRAGHVGALFAITTAGQRAVTTSAVTGTATSSIRVTGLWTDRTISLNVSGNNTGSTVTLQRSFDNAVWQDVPGESTVTNITTTYADGMSNEIVYYRAILANRIAPDTVTMELRIGVGTTRGLVRVYSYISQTQVGAHVLSPLGSTDATADWEEGQWSDANGWPTAVQFHEGRLWWAGINGIWGSISDAYDSFDPTFVGDAGPINRTIGSGPVDTINWLLSMKGMTVGAQGAEQSVRASSLDEVITPTNFNIKTPSTQGSGAVAAVKIDQEAYFVNRSSLKVFEMAFDIRRYDYQSTNLMELLPDGGRPGIVRMDAQRCPDTRIHCVRSDGAGMVGVMNRTEDVLAWVGVATSGTIEEVVVLPAINGNADDQVYYVVARTIGGATVRYLEKWAQEIDCLGDKQLCYLADSYVEYTGAATKTISGLSHLEGQSVVVWADGHDVGTIDTARPWTQTYTVAGGQITLAVAASNVVVGLGYTAQFRSAKLGASMNGISPLNQQKKVNHFGIILANTHAKGVKFGPTLNDTGSLCMDDMPGIEDGVAQGDVVNADYDQNLIEFPGTWTTDMRLCLQAQAPRPATVLAITYDAEQNA